MCRYTYSLSITLLFLQDIKFHNFSTAGDLRSFREMKLFNIHETMRGANPVRPFSSLVNPFTTDKFIVGRSFYWRRLPL